MANIKDLTVKMTIRVGLQDIEVSDRVKIGLEKMSNIGEFTDDDANRTRDNDLIAAFDWLNSNINDEDAIDIAYDIEEFTED